MNPATEPDDLRELMLRHLEDETSPEETQRLTLALRNSPAAQRDYAELLVQVTQLSTLGAEQNILALDRIESSRTSGWWPTGARWALAAAACLVAIAGSFYFTRPINDSGKELVEDSQSMANVDAVARLTRGAGLLWDSGTNDELEVGDSLEPGMLRLKAGVAELEFLSGAQVILEGPAEFELISDQEARLNSGKLRAQVPEHAHGFKIYTRELVVTDLGTEFALNERPNQAPEVHVFVGKVQLEFGNTNRAPLELGAGEGAQVEGGILRNIPANQREFIASDELERREHVELQARYEQWKKTIDEFAADPAMLVYFNFEGGGLRTNSQVVNHSRASSRGTDGRMFGAQWASGRWPDKGAVQFQNRNDRVRLKVTGEFASLTYAAWVSIDDLSRPNNALAMSQRFKPGEVRWDISSAGSLRLQVAGTNGHYETFSSPRLLKSQSKRWVHLAAVYDAPGKNVSLYLNGKRILSKGITAPSPLILDDIELGNWNPLLNPPPTAKERKERQRPSFKYREFQGRMDEFVLLSKPLSAPEIRKLYEMGKPRSEAALAQKTSPAVQ